ncbi:5-carboxymethyl-2-hydroxymuconate semialdehyde dehydrogenase [Klebsiella pneumoniae]|nr:5-carboxymethyl-2-hydroxymuconate semialdehyde dehydrogenase [Klebsiella pneumoniae]
MKKINHWINGKNVAGADYFHTTNPATGEVLAEVASGGEAEINQAVAAAKEAFPKWANLPMKERARLMRRLGDLIDQNVPEIASMETADTGLPIHQTKNVLIPRASHNFEFFAEVCQQMNGKTYPVDDKMLNYTLVQPVGVCALVSPWNVPFMTATWKVAPCLALGNTAVLKMSELSPLTADRLGELALEAGIPAGVLNVVQGYGATAGDALVRHHDVRAVSFTGGTATGRNIMKNAGLKKYSMELGGKSPVLIFEDADIERALDAALFTIFSINGERCTAGSRIFIQQSIYPEFVKRFAERANRLRVGDPTDPNTQVGALISQQHWEKVSGYIRLGIEEGATLLAGGADKPSDLPAHLKAGNFLRPTVLADVDNRMRVAQEEIFGPVACLLPFKDEAEGLHRDADVFHFGEHFKAVLAAFAAGAGGLHAAERLTQVAHVLGVDEHHPGFNTARRVSEAEAMDYVAGYTLCNDYAIRDYLENYYRPNLRVKSRDTLTPIGPWIVAKEAIPDPHNLALRTWVNGELRQQGTTADLIFSIPFLIAYLSEFMTLQPGDMIATGTPKGLSDVVPGDEVIVEVEGVGRLVNHIISQQAYEETLS